jgi:enoyl-CoA hydratase/carnithine racemase
MSKEDILVARDGGIATVTFNRPGKRNACSFAMWQRLGTLFAELGRDAEVRTVILTGAGGHFCAGADISEFETVRANAKAAEAYEHAGEAAMLAIRDCPKPVIAQVSGSCVGGGLALALVCDFRIADESARMGIPAARLGLVYSLLETRSLVNAAGATNAKRVLMTAKIFAAREAAQLGLIDELVPDPAAAVRALAETIAANAPLSVAGAKFIINAVAAGEAEKHEAEIHRRVMGAMDTEDFKEGRRAFMEKRPPVWRGR